MGDIMINKILNFGIDFSNKKKIEILRDIFIFFLVFSVCGWIYEELVFAIEEKMIVNRGALWGPWLTIYGFGGLVIMILLFRTKEKKILLGKINIRPIVVFLETIVISTIVELIGSYIIDWVWGDFKTLWDYSGELMNFDGRIALIPDIKFGFVSLLGIYLVQPILKKFISGNQKVVNITTICVFILFMIDVISRIWLGNNYVG
jgi:uncharacterized membrane protein